MKTIENSKWTLQKWVSKVRFQEFLLENFHLLFTAIRHKSLFSHEDAI